MAYKYSKISTQTTKINHNWQKTVKITNTQKIITTYGQNKDDEIIYVRRCTEPNEKVKQIQRINIQKLPLHKTKICSAQIGTQKK